MKRYESMKKMSQLEMADALCQLQLNESNCDACPVRDLCRPVSINNREGLERWRNGFWNYLEQEDEE